MFRLLRITGNSLNPTYQEGDFVFISKIPFLFHPLRPGDVIAFRQPSYGLLIKQVQRLEPESGAVFVTGSHPESIDSRHFGSIPRQAVLGRVIAHIHR